MVSTPKKPENISRWLHFVINGEEFNLHKKVCYEVGMQLADIGTNNAREDEFNPILGYAILRLDYLHNSCQSGVQWGNPRDPETFETVIKI